MDILENPTPCRFNAEKARDTIQKIAEEAGFDLVGVAEIAQNEKRKTQNKEEEVLDRWIKNDYHADMKWFVDSVEKRKDILKVMPDAKSVICVAMNYYCDTENKKDAKNQNSQFLAIARNCEFSEKPKIVGKIARYALGKDYHKIFDKKLKLFAQRLEEEILRYSQDDKDWIPASAGMTQSMTGMTEEKLGIIEERAGMTNAKFKYYSDTGPILERAWAVRAGLGFVGKNTNLITKYGSWVLLGEIITNIDLGLDPRLRGDDIKGGCGDCRRCLDACPTGALVAPYQPDTRLTEPSFGQAHPTKPFGRNVILAGTVDAQKCISYLTIEHKGDIPMELREKIGNRIFGCDACQEVCPFNIGRQTEGINFKTAQFNTDNYHFNRYGVKSDNNEIDLKEILSIKTDEEFLEKFAGSPLMRAKRRGLVRNACIATGNSGDKSLLPYLKECLNDKESIIVSHAKWAIEKLKKEI